MGLQDMLEGGQHFSIDVVKNVKFFKIDVDKIVGQYRHLLFRRLNAVSSKSMLSAKNDTDSLANATAIDQHRMILNVKPTAERFVTAVR
jgi:hypothetical protein